MSVLTGLDSDLAYPATPGVPESGLHALVRFRTYGALRGHFAGRPGCFVGQDRNIYYRRGDSKTYVAPDVFVCCGVDPEPLELDRSFRPWDAGGPPEFVLEIASDGTWQKDLFDKPAIYLEVGVSEYWRFDPTGGEFYTPVLQGDRLAGGRWQRIPVAPDDDGRLCGRSDVLGLDLHAETRRLHLRDARTGRWLPDPDDTRQEREEVLARAVAAEAALGAEAAARRAAEAEVAALRARLSDQP